MNASSGLESRLLGLPRPGETLRFIWTRADDNRFRMAVEGVGTDKDSGRSLGVRIGAFLELLGQEGKDFSSEGAIGSGAETESGVWLEVAPRENAYPLGRDGEMGFSGASEAMGRIRLPALAPVSAPDLSGYFLDLVAGLPAVRQVCLSFTRVDLTPERERILDRNLGQSFAEVLELATGVRPAGDLQRFMALWLVRRSGWRLRLWIQVASEDVVPEVPLELMGREWFDTECRVHPARAADKGAEDPLDFMLWYPDGWSFPPLFPPAHAEDRLEVEPGWNPRLPVLPTEGVLIGEVSGRPVRMPLESRDLHTYILGATGTGKSTLLKRLIRHDLAGDEAVVVLDPHGDLFREVADTLPAHRREDVLLLDPGSGEPAPEFNILADLGEGPRRHQQVEFLLGELMYLFQDLWTDNPEAFGPMFELYFRNTVLLLAYQPKVWSLGVFDRVLVDEKFRKELLATCTRRDVCDFWLHTAEKVAGEASLRNVAPYISCKMSPLLQSFYVGDMIRRKRNVLELDIRLELGGVVLVNLDKGLLGHAGSRLLGSLLTAELFAVGLRRGRRLRAERPPVNVYIDEFQNFVSPTLASMFAEARKFGLRLHVANQTLGQLTQGRQNLSHSVLGNVGIQIFFRVGVQDSADLEPFFQPFTRNRMQELLNFRAFARMMTPAGPLRPFVMKTLPEE
ncbi:MAG: type IV secretion system DNA-binding domain-containing protein [Verrucomicrobia bacterium]|nr:type IV secretion system DNA-binding domain-containing protein [Verrucomicrobiota bacterium]MCH8510987.1 type IV secretion system DNA-binding domain-containing protein [Kiritimatiellia bacterium]